jgi:Carboxypeptidase regulatory-like domain
LTSQGYSRRPLRLAPIGVLALAWIVYCIALLAPAGALAATGSISGTVIDAETHAPIEKVQACAFEVDEEENFECAKTAANGQYTIPTLQAGTYEVGFYPGNGVNYVFQVFDGKSSWAEADPVIVAAGATTPEVDAELLPGGAISGKVTTAVGAQPVEEVEVCATEVPEEEALGCAYSEAGGSYEIVGLPEAEFKVEFLPETGDLLGQYYKHKYTWATADPVAVTTGDVVPGIDADLDRGAEIHGTVYSATTGLPLREILVCSVFASSGRLTNCDETNTSGQYTLSPLYSGSYKVAFSLEFREFFAGEELEPENDGYPTQFYNGKSTLAAADTLSLVPPNILNGIDGHIGSPPALVPTPLPIPAKPKSLKCKKHFHKKKVNGKVKCVRIRAKGRRHHHRGAAGHTRARLLATLR